MWGSAGFIAGLVWKPWLREAEVGVALDPEGVETRIIHHLVDFLGKDVLEIGCGEGRLTWRYADRAASVLAIDSHESKIALAQGCIPEHLRSAVTFQAADVATFDPPEAAFDVAVLSWSI